MTEYFCFPVCVKCTASNSCVKMQPKIEMDSVPADEYIRARAVRNFNIDSAYLPCGCFGIPWPIIYVLGQNIEEVLCEIHGWLAIKKGYKFSNKPPKVKSKKKKLADNEIPF